MYDIALSLRSSQLQKLSLQVKSNKYTPYFPLPSEGEGQGKGDGKISFTVT
jgi:hypothetical protein